MVAEENSDSDETDGEGGGVRANGETRDDVGGVAGFGGFGDITNGGVVGGGVVVRDEQNHEGHEKADQRGQVDTHGGGDLSVVAEAIGKKDLGERPECGGGGKGTDENSEAEEAGRVSLAKVNREDAEDGGKNGDTTDDEGVGEGGGLGLTIASQDGEVGNQNATDETDGVGFEDIGGHAGAIAHIIADVIGDGGRVAGVVLFQLGFDFTNEVGPDVGRFRIDSPAKPGKDANEGGAEGQAGETVDGGAEAEVFGSDQVEGADGEEGKGDHEKAGDGTPVESVTQGGGTAEGGGLGGADIGHDGDPHSGEAGDETTGSTDEEADAGGQIFEVADRDEEKEGDPGDSLELAIQIGGGSFLNGGGDFPHAVISVGLGANPLNEAPSGDQTNEAGDQTQGQCLFQKEVRHGELLENSHEGVASNVFRQKSTHLSVLVRTGYFIEYIFHMTKYPQNGVTGVLDPRVLELERIATLLQRRFLVDLLRQTSTKRLSIPQFTLLGFLGLESGVPMGMLAKRMGHATSATTGLVDRLEAVGLVRRQAQKGDRRQKLVEITTKGKELMARLQGELRHHLGAILTQLEEKDQDAWVRIYRVMENYCRELPRN